MSSVVFLFHDVWYRWVDHNQLEELTIPWNLDFLNADYNSLKHLPSFDFSRTGYSCAWIDTLYLENNALTTLQFDYTSLCYLESLFAQVHVASPSQMAFFTHLLVSLQRLLTEFNHKASKQHRVFEEAKILVCFSTHTILTTS